jgi:hypothetical protein
VRKPTGKDRHRPSATEDPLCIRVGSRVLSDDLQIGPLGFTSGEVTAESFETPLLCMDMGVLEAGKQHAAVQVEDFSPPADQRADVLLAADRRDPAVPYGDRFRWPASRAGPIDPSSDKH